MADEAVPLVFSSGLAVLSAGRLLFKLRLRLQDLIFLFFTFFLSLLGAPGKLLGSSRGAPGGLLGSSRGAPGGLLGGSQIYDFVVVKIVDRLPGWVIVQGEVLRGYAMT